MMGFKEIYKLKINLTRQNKALFFLICTLLAIGISQFRNYGLGVDEPYMRRHGASTAKYILGIFFPSLLNDFKDIPYYHTLNQLETSQDRTHGTVFELPLTAIEATFNLTNNLQLLYYVRHMVTFAFCAIGMLVVFKYLLWRLKSVIVGIVGIGILLFSPRLFAEYFYNSKDAVFMFAYATAIVFSIRFLFSPRKLTSITAAFFCAYAINIRPIALIIPIIIIMFFLIRKFYFKMQNYIIKEVITFLSMIILFIYVLWPYLWANPLERFMEVAFLLSNYDLVGNLQVLTNGQYISAQSQPWYYLFIWMGVTTPIFYLIIIILGFTIQLSRFLNLNYFKKVLINNELSADMLIFIYAVLPVIIIILTKSTLYDGWRHFYFIYTPLVILGLTNWMPVQHWLKTKNVFLSLILIYSMYASITLNALWIYNNRPLQNVYFNYLAGSDIRSKWEMDYWGLGNRQALQFILNYSQKNKINIAQGSSMQLYRSSYMFSKQEATRMNFVDEWSEADFLITNYRGVKPEADYKYEVLFEPVFRKWVGNANVYTIYKKK